MLPGGGDDTLIGTGHTDAAGNFNDGQSGIGVSPALVSGEKIFAFDADHSIAGPIVTVPPPAPTPTPQTNVPAVSPWGAALLAASLGLALGLRTWLARTSAGRRS
jgi:hypothetical protein